MGLVIETTPTSVGLVVETAPAVVPVASDLQNLATSPQRVRTDEGTVEERPIKEILQADVYNRLDAQEPVQTATVMSRWGISVARTRPPDALGNQCRSPWGPRFQ